MSLSRIWCHIKKRNFMKIPREIVRIIIDPKYRDWIISYTDPLRGMMFEKMGDLNEDKYIYYISFPDEYSGFFANWTNAIKRLEFCERFNLIPYIDWTEKSPYYCQMYNEKTSNPFEYYYVQPYNLSSEEVKASAYVLTGEHYSVSFVNRHAWSYDSDFDIEQMAYFHKKYMFLRPEIEQRINKEKEELLYEDKYIAVHIRGVEWGDIISHPIPLKLKKYEECIDTILKNGYKKIFVATDNEDNIVELKKKYGDMIVSYTDTLRAKNGSHQLAIFDKSEKRVNNEFLLGYEVLRDAITMVHADAFIAGYSNISLAVRTIKKSIDEEFEYIEMLNNEICQEGRTVSVAIKK